jgi:tight adherence protein C
MSSSLILLALGCAALLVALAAVFLLHVSDRRQRFLLRVQMARGAVRQAGAEAANERWGGVLARAVIGVGRAVAGSGLLPARTIAELDETLRMAGFRGANAVSLLVGAKVALMIGVPAICYVMLTSYGVAPLTRDIIALAGGILGLIGPDMTLGRIRKGYLARLERGVPDALDLLVICSQAGVSLAPAITRVGEEIALVHPEISREFLEIANELLVVADAATVLAAAGTRTGLDSIKRLAATLSQSLQYGTPVTQALRALSVEMRKETLTRFEERAARLPVLLTLPMIVFVLPCVFLVVGGPAVLQIQKLFAH